MKRLHSVVRVALETSDMINAGDMQTNRCWNVNEERIAIETYDGDELRWCSELPEGKPNAYRSPASKAVNQGGRFNNCLKVVHPTQISGV